VDTLHDAPARRAKNHGHTARSSLADLSLDHGAVASSRGLYARTPRRTTGCSGARARHLAWYPRGRRAGPLNQVFGRYPSRA
jgi:hypothetical protein